MTEVSTAAPVATEAARLADELERAHRGGAWHGPSLAEALADVDAATAASRPIPAGHTIWEITGHLSSWLDTCRRRIEGEPTKSMPPEVDWPPGDARGEKGEKAEEAWRRELATLEERYRRFHAAVEALDDSRLDDPVAGSSPTVRGLILGMIQHHAYHGGQIVLLGRSGGAR